MIVHRYNDLRYAKTKARPATFCRLPYSPRAGRRRPSRLADLAVIAGDGLDPAVVDMTGLKSRYQVSLDISMASRADVVAAILDGDRELATLQKAKADLKAVQDGLKKLGLELEPRKGAGWYRHHRSSGEDADGELSAPQAVSDPAASSRSRNMDRSAPAGPPLLVRTALKSI